MTRETSTTPFKALAPTASHRQHIAKGKPAPFARRRGCVSCGWFIIELGNGMKLVIDDIEAAEAYAAEKPDARPAYLPVKDFIGWAREAEREALADEARKVAEREAAKAAKAAS